MIHEHPAQPTAMAEAMTFEQVERNLPSSVGGSIANALSGSYGQRLSEMDQRQLLLQTVTIYDGWQLVSIQHRPDNDALVAYLVRNSDRSDPMLAIREGRTMQIIMDNIGDMKIQYARRTKNGFWARFFGKLLAIFTLKV